MFGPHMLMELYNCPKDKLSDIAMLTEVLDKMPEEMNMHKIMPPYVFKYQGLYEDDWGLSGIVLIAESHIAFHTFPDKGFVTVDIFSCKDFDIIQALNTIQEVFTPEKIEHQLLMRGREFPRSMTKAGMILESERLAIN